MMEGSSKMTLSYIWMCMHMYENLAQFWLKMKMKSMIAFLIDLGYILGAFWEHFGSFLGPFWEHFSISADISILRALWMQFWTLWGRFWAPSWGLSEALPWTGELFFGGLFRSWSQDGTQSPPRGAPEPSERSRGSNFDWFWIDF